MHGLGKYNYLSRIKPKNFKLRLLLQVVFQGVTQMIEKQLEFTVIIDGQSNEEMKI